MKKHAVFMGAVAAVVLSLSACAGEPSYRAPDLTFANVAPVSLNVAQIEVRDAYKPPMTPPNVEHTFQTPLYVTTENLLKRQLAAGGQANILRAVITDASVVREELPVDGGFMNYFKIEESARLNGRVVVRFELVSADAPDIVIRHMTLTVKRQKTILEDASVSDLERASFRLTEDMMSDLSGGIMTSVRGAFGG